MVHPNIRKLVLDYYSNLMKVDFVVSLFTECDFHKAIVKDNELVIDDPVEKIYYLSTDNTLYVGKIVADSNSPKSLYYISKKSQDKIEVQPLLEITKDISLPLIPSQHEKLVIKKDDRTEIKTLRKEIKALKEKIEKEKIEIAVIGQEDTGKSTVLNALIKRTVFPAGTGRTTYTKTKLVPGNKMRLKLKFILKIILILPANN